MGLLRNWVEREKKEKGELVVVTGLTFLCLLFYDFLCSFSFPLLVKNWSPSQPLLPLHATLRGALRDNTKTLTAAPAREY